MIFVFNNYLCNCIFSGTKFIQEKNSERINVQKDHQKNIDNLRKDHKKELDVCNIIYYN